MCVSKGDTKEWCGTIFTQPVLFDVLLNNNVRYSLMFDLVLFFNLFLVTDLCTPVCMAGSLSAALFRLNKMRRSLYSGTYI